jgi:hypothetical protein
MRLYRGEDLVTGQLLLLTLDSQGSHLESSQQRVCMVD